MSLKRDLVLVSFLTCPTNFVLVYFYYYYLFTYLTGCFFVVFAQAIQEVFIVEKWVKDARNEASLADNLHVETSKSLTAA